MVAWLLGLGLRILTGARAVFGSGTHDGRQRIYCVNHTSHIDFLLVWIALPAVARRRLRPVAAADYWRASWVRRWVVAHVFHGVLVDRSGRAAQPLEPIFRALTAGDSILLFPEGTRGNGGDLQPLKYGIYFVAREHPDSEIVPVWIDNAYRAMPRGAAIPVPFQCSIRFGAPLRLGPDEDKDAFLARLRAAMLEARAV